MSMRTFDGAVETPAGSLAQPTVPFNTSGSVGSVPSAKPALAGSGLLIASTVQPHCPADCRINWRVAVVFAATVLKSTVAGTTLMRHAGAAPPFPTRSKSYWPANGSAVV